MYYTFELHILLDHRHEVVRKYAKHVAHAMSLLRRDYPTRTVRLVRTIAVN